MAQSVAVLNVIQQSVAEGGGGGGWGWGGEGGIYWESEKGGL